ncbi:MAG: respiratory nitrate reductase subunit gamma, partial [Phenylobacterium sp.]|nr:respiratory nitrate reductase subunit gamma [Phenylobacterium sp.]
IFKAHLVLGMTILLVFPFTRLVHMLSAPVWYLNRRGWQLVRTRRLLPHRRDNAAPIYPTRPGVQPATTRSTTPAVRPSPLKAGE